MGFWSSVAGLAKGAGNAMQEKIKEQQYEMWKKLSVLPEERLVDIIKQHEDRRQMQSLAILALSLKNRSAAQSLMDDDIKSSFERMRKNLALEENRYAEEQRQAIDSLLRSYY
ncbi:MULTISPECIES: hypothetical protein [Acinetobacter]|uniref:hypothetical protein n=1 Tax=Acinetobacter TaxID=469 RepID=UPI00141B6E11|nr:MULTISPECIES: hypothetical protein [Acinetobacter]MCS4298889.1 hypothetical protein [Acinetobacter guillouiae]MCW2252373.1 hypothetical protein [Acinetobacter sp. BIGb0204]NII38040.1 hypothetical protein [Acinetobacter sp. BIGb0196]